MRPRYWSDPEVPRRVSCPAVFVSRSNQPGPFDDRRRSREPCHCGKWAHRRRRNLVRRGCPVRNVLTTIAGPEKFRSERRLAEVESNGNLRLAGDGVLDVDKAVVVALAGWRHAEGLQRRLGFNSVDVRLPGECCQLRVWDKSDASYRLNLGVALERANVIHPLDERC